MTTKITMFDYNFDWVLKDYNVHPRSTPGTLSREQVVAFCGTLGLDGIEIRHDYWSDCSPFSVRQICRDAGLAIVTYLFDADLALPKVDRQSQMDRAFSLIDRTAELGAKRAFFVPALFKTQWTLEEQRGWLIESLHECAERAHQAGVTLLSENIDYPPVRPFMGRGADCRSICAAVDSPGFRLIYDACAPLFVEEDSLETLRSMAPYVVHAHVKNSRPVGPGENPQRQLASISGKLYTGTLLDGGSIQLRPILAELRRLGLCEHLLIEYQGEEDPRTAANYNLALLREMLKEVRESASVTAKQGTLD